MAAKGCSPSSSGRSATSLVGSLVHSPSPHYSPSVRDRLEAGTSASPTKVVEFEQASSRDEVPFDGPSFQGGLQTGLRLDPKLTLGESLNSTMVTLVGLLSRASAHFNPSGGCEATCGSEAAVVYHSPAKGFKSAGEPQNTRSNHSVRRQAAESVSSHSDDHGHATRHESAGRISA